MKAIKHFTILMLALCCSFFAKAQCPNAFTDTVRGNSVAVNAIVTSGTGFLYAWYLDGSLVQSANPNTSYTYQNVLAGTHRLCMYVYENNTFLCDSVCNSVTVTSCGTLTAQWTDQIGTHDTVRFVAYDTNSIAHHAWSFGDNTTASGTTVTHVYSAPGTYHVCFYAYIPGSICTDSLCETVVVPASSCGTASFLSYIMGDTAIRTYSTSTGVDTSTNYLWYVYGPTGTLLQYGATGHTNNFTSHGLAAGTYRVCLYLYNGNQVLCDSTCNSVTVLNCTSLSAAWQYVPTSTNSDSIRFYPATNPSGTVYAWTFGDGSTSTVSNPTHVYAQAGTYTACLITSNNAIICRDTFCQTVTVGNPNACGTASFALYILNDSLIRGYSTSTGTTNTSTYVWNVYNMNGGLIHSYNTGTTSNLLTGGMPIGTYRVCLDLYNGQNVLCDSVCNTVNVYRCSSLNPQWTYTSSTANDTLKVTAPTNNPAGTTYAWTFGDGSTSTLAGLTHVYSQSGVYTVCLIVSNPALTCHDTICSSITIGNPNACGTASFLAYVYSDSLIHAYSNSTGTADSSSYVWNIYNANNVVVQTSSTGHTSNFLSTSLPAGTYRLCLDLYNAQHLFCDSFCNTIQILRCSSLNPQWTYTSSTANDTLKVNAPSNNPTGTTYAWTFGDGGTSSYPSVTHVYSQAGAHTVCLIVSNPALTCHDTLCQNVTVGGANCSGVSAAWTYAGTSTTGSVLQFTAPTSNPSGTSYVWSFGDGTTNSTSPNPTHVYANAGSYTICLVAVNTALGCRDTSCGHITITASTPCGVASVGAYVVGDTSIHAYSNSTGVDTNSIYNWTIRNSSGAIVATHNGRNYYFFATGGLPNGTYSVCMYLYNSNQQFCDSACTVATLSGCPGITAQWTYAISHDTVVFEAMDTNSHANHYWSFGDGTSGSGTRVVHVYPNYGTVHVCFYDYLIGASCADSLCETITIPTSTACGTASFQDYVYGDTSIHAYSNSTGTTSATIYKWTIKGTNGNIIQTQTGTSNYIYSQHLASGYYNVCLTLYNGTSFCDSTCSYVFVPTIGTCGTPSFADTVYAGLGGGAIHAYTTTTNVDSLSQISWKIWGPNGNLVQVFTGGDFTSSVLDSGTYVVCQYIRATNSTRICDSVCQSVVVAGGTNPCTGLSAAWTHGLQSNSTDSIEFHAANDPSGTYYRWTFGDGTYGYGQNITHGYAQSGTYTVCLVVFNGSTCRDTVCGTVTITTTTPCPVASFSQYVYQDSIIHAFSNSTGVTANTIYEWVVTNANGVVVQTSTGQGTSASLLSHALPNGTYNVCLFVYATTNTFCDSACQSITIANTIHPCSGLNANFSTTTLTNGNISFVPADTATGVSHYWHFGDGTVSTNNDPTHAYTSAGLYHVCQYVYYTGITNCIDSFCTNVQAGASGCIANFSYQRYTNNAIHFTNLSTSTDSIIAYRWTFGDGNSGTFASGTHTYANSGRYYVCLLIYSQHGCSSTYCDSITVTADPCSGLSANYTYTYTQNGGVHFAGSTTTSNLITNLWTFGDGTTATTFDPTHYYAQAGTYRVCHIVTIAGTLCADTSCETIQGTGTGSSCHANFTDSAVVNTTTVIFTNHSTSSDSIVSYVWSFGDGSSSTSANTHHTYTASGSAFYVCLTINTTNGCTNTYCDSVHVGHASSICHASFTYTIDSCQVVTFTSTSTGDLSFLRWIYGDGTTDTLSHPTHVYAQGGHYTVILHFYGINCYNFDTVVINVPSCTAVGDTVCGVVFNDLNGNGVQNTGEAGIPLAEIHVGNYITHADSNGHYVIVVPPGTYSIYYCAPTGYTFTIPVHNPLNSTSNCSAYQNIVITSGSNCGYNFGIQSNSVTICGTVYFDANNNHSQDQGESGLANAQVVFSDEGTVVYTVYTDQYGHYCAVLPVDTYVISVHSTSYTNGVVSPGSITVVATTGGGSYDNNNFGVYVQQTSCDLSINVSPNSTVTPGYPAWYQIEVCNVGTSVSSGTVNLFYDPSLRYNYSSPAATSQNSTTFTASWALNNLNPGSCQYYYVSLTADSSLVAGQFIFTLATVNLDGCQDVNQGNNVDTVHQNVTASWDPNNKQVSPLGEGPQGLIHGNQWLTYTINFQNTGTAPAVNIVVLDTLSQYLDISTFKMIGSNLPYTLQFNGNEAIWKFNAVSLPDSATDQQGSHGFVTFMILPLQDLPTKTPITNQADIFFDYNAGVSTNKTLNTVDYTLAVTNIAPSDVTITLQPNPFSQLTTIKVDGAEGPYQLNVYDLLGRVVKNQPAIGNIFIVDRGTMASGVYMYEVTHNGTVIGKGKMVAQ